MDFNDKNTFVVLASHVIGNRHFIKFNEKKITKEIKCKVYEVYVDYLHNFIVWEIM